MTMTNDRLEELAILNSIGTLDGDELREFEALMNSSGVNSQANEWAEIAAQLTLGRGTLLVPRAGVKESLLRKIQERHATERSLEGPGGSARYENSPGITSIFPDRMPWEKHPVPGLTFKVLSESKKRGYVTMLMKVEPGTVFPEHHHTGEEECYVLSGSIILDGKKMGVGVLHHGDENSDHGQLSTEEGALVLLVVAKEDYIPPIS
jgi:quercetin dioxygenase-like cupin family protein